MSGCTFTPDLPARRVVRSRQTPGASIAGSATSGKDRRFENDAKIGSADASITACSRSSGGRGSERRSSRHQRSANCYGGEAEDKLEKGGDVGICARSVGISMANGRAATNGVDNDSGSWPLPENWSAFVTPEGREYFFDARRDVVQWERPT